MTPELAQALDELAAERDEDRSRLVEILLREHPLVHRRIQRRRDRGPGREGGRRSDLKEAVLTGRAAGRRWERRTEDGEVRVRGRSE